MAHAHAHGIVHRDVKPSNLLTSPDGTVHVTDFGLARNLAEDGNLTVSGAVLGTPAYMAPEQARGERGDERTDVFGLGATLFALVEGRPPRDGAGVVELLESAIRAPLPDLAGRDDLVVVARKATELDAGDRYASAAALADDLDLYLAGLPVTASPIGPAGRAWRKAKRHPRATLALGVLLLAVLAGSLWGITQGRQRAARRALEERADRVLARADGVLKDIRQMQATGAYEADALERALADHGALADEALGIAPDYAPALEQRGVSLLARERYGEAEAVFDRILSADEGNETARSGRARARLLQVPAEAPTAIATSAGMQFEPAPPDPAAAALLRAAADDFARLPADHPDAAAGSAALAFYAGDYATALGLLEERLAEQPYLARERLMLAHAQLVTHDFEAAAESARQLLRRGYDEATVRSIHAYAVAGLGRLEEAVEDMAAVLESHPDWEPQRNFLGFWLVQLGRPAEALPHYDRLVDAHPDDVTYRLGRSIAYQGAGNREAALADAEHACRVAPDDAEAHWSRGGALTGTPEAIAAYDRAIELDPDYTAAYGQRGFTHLLLEHYAEAERDGLRAIEGEPDYPQWRFLHAMALVGLQRLDEGEAELDRALALGLAPGTGHLLRGRVRRMRGDCHGALADLEEAVRTARRWSRRRWTSCAASAGSRRRAGRWRRSRARAPVPWCPHGQAPVSRHVARPRGTPVRALSPDVRPRRSWSTSAPWVGSPRRSRSQACARSTPRPPTRRTACASSPGGSTATR